MNKKILQGFNAATAAIGLSILTACTAPPRDGQALSMHSGLRHLTPGEIDLAQTIFGNTIDYDDVYIKTNALPLRSRAYNSIIRISPREYTSDFSLAPLEARRTFIHEMEHIRQEQSGIDLVGSAISLFFQGGYHESVGYEYGDIELIERFSDLNIEQKASLTEHFYAVRENYSALAFDSQKEDNCTFQRNALELLQGHLPHLRMSRDCE